MHPCTVVFSRAQRQNYMMCNCQTIGKAKLLIKSLTEKQYCLLFRKIQPHEEREPDGVQDNDIWGQGLTFFPAPFLFIYLICTLPFSSRGTHFSSKNYHLPNFILQQYNWQLGEQICTVIFTKNGFEEYWQFLPDGNNLYSFPKLFWKEATSDCNLFSRLYVTCCLAPKPIPFPAIINPSVNIPQGQLLLMHPNVGNGSCVAILFDHIQL